MLDKGPGKRAGPKGPAEREGPGPAGGNLSDFYRVFGGRRVGKLVRENQGTMGNLRKKGQVKKVVRM